MTKTVSLFRIFFVALMMCATTLLGQSVNEITVTGKVIDDKGETVIGASILVKGTGTGVITDIDGNYSIKVLGSQSVLIFSYVGLTPVSEVVGDRSVINVTMASTSEVLEEIVVTALGIKKEKKKLGYAVQDLIAPGLTKVPAANTASNLTGKIAGLKVSNSPNLFDTPALLLRGVAPVVVIDGVPVESATFWEVAPEDIESMSVFLVGAYQEILGDMHNLFGDTNAVHVSVNEKGYNIEQIIDGETVAEVLDYVQYNPKKLVRTLETWVTKSVKEGKISLEEGKEFLSNYRSGLYGYTYLE